MKTQRLSAVRDGNRTPTSVPEVRMGKKKLESLPVPTFQVSDDSPIRKSVTDAFDKLSEDDRDLIMDSFGIDLDVALPTSQIAMKWECSEEKANRMVEDAVKRWKTNLGI